METQNTVETQEFKQPLNHIDLEEYENRQFFTSDSEEVVGVTHHASLCESLLRSLEKCKA